MEESIIPTKKKLDEKLMKEFNQRMTAIQDAERGIPESLITQSEAAHRSLERAFVESNPAIKNLLKKSEKVHEASRGEIEKLDRDLPRYRADPEYYRMALDTSVGICEGCMRDFKLPFIEGLASESYGTESPVTDVDMGMVGWGVQSNPPPELKNTGAGDGKIISGNLYLLWRTTVPHDGIFSMRPNQNRTSFPVFGSHKVRGEGWWGSSNDASVEVRTWIIVYLDSEWLLDRHTLVSWDATKSANRKRSFGKWIDLPGRITFQAQAGQRLGMYVLLHGHTWANDEGLAKINIDSFGLPSNYVNDMHIDVVA